MILHGQRGSAWTRRCTDLDRFCPILDDQTFPLEIGPGAARASSMRGERAVDIDHGVALDAFPGPGAHSDRGLFHAAPPVLSEAPKETATVSSTVVEHTVIHRMAAHVRVIAAQHPVSERTDVQRERRVPLLSRSPGPSLAYQSLWYELRWR